MSDDTETAALSRLRFITESKSPVCCGSPMVAMYLNVGDLTDNEINNLDEHGLALYIETNALFSPVWTCEACHKETEIDGLDWPTPAAEEDILAAPVANVRRHWAFCPHCGEKLNSENVEEVIDAG